MRFLGKDPNSSILADGLAYSRSSTRQDLRARLLAEQHGFCAYTERHVTDLDAVDIEHFDADKKAAGDDDYYNYYAVTHVANQWKADKDRTGGFRGASFFKSRFFQSAAEHHRVRYDAVDDAFVARDPADTEVVDLIAYLGFNEDVLIEERRAHVASLREVFDDANWDSDRRRKYFADYPHHLSFVTAIETGLDLPDLLAKVAA